MALVRIASVFLTVGVLSGCLGVKSPIEYLPIRDIPCPSEEPRDTSLSWPVEEFEKAEDKDDLIALQGSTYKAYKSKDVMLRVWRTTYRACLTAVKNGKSWVDNIPGFGD